MSSSFKYFLEKHKTKIAVGVAALVVLIIISAFVMILLGEEEPVEVYQPKVGYASHYIVGNEKSISLHDTTGTQINLLSFDNILYSKNKSDKMMVYANDEFWQITAITKDASYDGKNFGLQKVSVLKHDTINVKSFVWSDEYIVMQRGDDTFAIYNRKTETFKYLSPIPDVSNYMLIGKYLVYTVGNTINSVNVTNEKTVTIDVGAESYGFAQMGENVVVFNKFGNGKNTTTVFVLNPEDLYIEQVLTENTLNVYPISGEKPMFIRKANTLVLAEIQENGKLNSITLNIKSGEAPFSSENTLWYKDYIYSLKDGSMMIISVNGKYIEHTINISGLTFCPAYLAAE